MNMRVLWAVFVATALASASVASAKVARAWNDLQTGPRVVGYNADKDEIIHQNSIFSTVIAGRRPGGEHSYSGNRLEAYQYHGKRGTGGLYDALEVYKNKLNGRNYQYRRGKAY